MRSVLTSVLFVMLLEACAFAAPRPLEMLVRRTGVNDPAGAVRAPIVVLLHGYGSRPESYLGLAERTDLPLGTDIVLPRAPLALPSGSRAWWPLPDDRAVIRRERMPGMDDARRSVTALLHRLATQWPHRPLVLGGFSQGAMVALDVALHDPVPIAGLVLMSGTMIDEPATLARLGERRGLHVYMSHGVSNPVLRFDDDASLRDAMVARGLDVDFTSYEGGHDVTPRVCMEVAAFVRRCAGERPVE